MQIVLFRHGPAGRRDASRWPDDGERPLTARGETRTRQASAGLMRVLEAKSLHVFASPLARARRTAELFVEESGAELQILEALSPAGAPQDVLPALRQQGPDDTVVLVGHEPDLGLLAGWLIFGHTHAVPIKKAGACVLEVDPAVEPGHARLVALLPPRVLRALGRRKGAVV